MFVDVVPIPLVCLFSIQFNGHDLDARIVSLLLTKTVSKMSDRFRLPIDGPDTLRGAVILLVIGLTATGFGAYDYIQQSDTVANSVEVNAEIIETGVVEANSPGSSLGVDHKPTVRFTYNHEGTSYTGTNVFPADTSPDYDTRSEARSVIDGYETGDMVTAYVDSDEPDDAFLKNQTTNAPLLFAGIGMFFTILGGISTAKLYRRAD
jgi:hypothetical protein